MQPISNLCACGCGAPCRGTWKCGHNARVQNIGRKHSPQTRAKIGAGNRKRKSLSESGRASLRASALRNFSASPDVKCKRMLKAWAEGKFDNRNFGPEIIEKIRQATIRQFAEAGNPFKGKKHTEEAKQKMRESIASRKRVYNSCSKVETRFGLWLRESGLEVESQKRIDHYTADFAYECNNVKFVIEVDGCYFHGCQRCHPNGAFGNATLQREKDRHKTAYLAQLGWIVLRIAEHAIKEDGEIFAQCLAAMILSFKPRINEPKEEQA